MVQWKDPTLTARLNIIDMNVTFLLLGLYGWEYLSSLDVEYAVIRGRLAFRWALVPYLVGRMFQFFFLLLSAIRTVPPSNNFICLPVTMVIAISGDIALGCSSMNFMIRTWVIWKDTRLVHILLVIFALGQWIVLALDVANLRPTQIPGGCKIYITHREVNAAVLVYSVCYDFLVLVLSIVALSRQRSKSPLIQRLRAQGFVYFVVAVVTYIPPTVFAFMGVNHVLAMTGITATTARYLISPNHGI
ncbi:hypothetical protein L210DRAFT_2024675 [Boletus edulis BED1]|uniref:Uncharacterized protein n=1 Tax=Boletus edulis BED1 TaxID=1328754 RepID=A0AAD4GLZ1_BOLED|nr:hypothetical protein L210DRAFT_2024675 [Boletus edulis BED1]